MASPTVNQNPNDALTYIPQAVVDKFNTEASPTGSATAPVPGGTFDTKGNYTPPQLGTSATNSYGGPGGTNSGGPSTTTPTIVTDANTRETTLPDITSRTNAALSNINGVVQGAAPDGSIQSANGNYVDKAGNQYSSAPAAIGTTGNTTTEQPSGQSGAAPASAAGALDSDNEYESFLKSMFDNNPSTATEGIASANDPYLAMLSTMKATSDSASATLIAATQNQFAQRKAQLAATNAAGNAGLMQTLISNGEARYAPLLAGSAMTADEQNGVLALSNIDSQESAAVAQLQKAQSDEDYQTMGKWLDHLDSLREDKINAASKLADDSAAATKAINDAKTALTTQINSIAEDAAKNGATSDQLAAITNSPDVGSAITAAGSSLKTYQSGVVGEYQYYVDQAKAAGQVPVSFNDYQTIDANRKASATAAASNTNGSVDLSSFDTATQQKLQANGFTNYNGSVQNLASQLVSGALAPSELSKRATGNASYNDVLTAADAYSMATTGNHFNIAQADRDYKFANNPSTQSTLNYLGSLVGSDDGSGNMTGGNLDDLVALSNGITRTSFPALNDAAAWTRYETGDPKIAAFNATATEVADQVAKILQGGGTGGGTSDAKLQQAANLFSTSFTKAQLISTVNALKPLLGNRAKSMVNDNPYLSDYADQFGISQPGSSTNSSGTTADSLVGSEATAQTAVDSAVKSNPSLQKEVYGLLSTPDPTLGRVMTYSEIQQYLQATGAIQ